MAYQAIGLGAAADDGTGDNLRAGADKVNDNFVELYTLLGDASDLSSGISATSSVITLTAPTISGVVGGTQTSATITTLTSTTISGLSSLTIGTSALVGTLAIAAGSLTDSSGAIDFGNENLSSTGTLSIGAITTDAVMNINTAVTDVFIVLNGTDGSSTNAGDNIIDETDSDDIIGERGTVNLFLVEGTADDFETTLDVIDPTADRTITFPNITGTVVTTGDTNTVTGTMIAEDTVAEANMADDAIGQHQLKTLSTLLIKNSSGTTLKTLYAAGA